MDEFTGQDGSRNPQGKVRGQQAIAAVRARMSQLSLPAIFRKKKKSRKKRDKNKLLAVVLLMVLVGYFLFNTGILQGPAFFSSNVSEPSVFEMSSAMRRGVVGNQSQLTGFGDISPEEAMRYMQMPFDGEGNPPLTEAMMAEARAKGIAPCTLPDCYTVMKGDTMYGISRAWDIPFAELCAANPHVTDPNKIYPGMHINISR